MANGYVVLRRLIMPEVRTMFFNLREVYWSVQDQTHSLSLISLMCQLALPASPC